MKRKVTIPLFAVLVLSLTSFACAGLLNLEEEPVSGEFGPVYVPQEHQARTFEALWTHLEENYIYFEGADVNWSSVKSQYLERINAGLTHEEFDDLLRELESDLPEGSLVYQSRGERIETDIADLSSYEGIGAFIGFDEEPEPHVVLLGVIEGSPAEQAGLKAHDSIFAVDGSPVMLEEGLDVVERIRGPSGTSVTLEVQTPGESERSVEVKRARLTSTGVLEAHEIADTNFAYMLFPPVSYSTLMEDVAENLRAFTTNQTLEGLILDLRVAGSSRDWPFQEMFGLFHEGAVGEFYNRQDRQLLELEGQEVFDSHSIPLVILVGQNTQGFPEILAASLQMHERATLVGAATPGAVETTSSYYLPNGSRIFVETTSFVLPNGDQIGTSGVQPDVHVEAGWDEILPGEDPVLDAALERLESQP
ncbi:MAG TPA: S41 family peptidase [Anaerolineales bacterium]|nr:S41 family peptidase [Anaerolineales bacterium]